MTVQDPHVKAEGLINELIATVLTYSNANEETKPAAKVEFDGTRAALAAYIEQQAKQIAELRAMRLRLDHRIHCQRKYLRENWMTAEQRQNSLGSQTARKSWLTVRQIAEKYKARATAAEVKYTNLLAESATIKERTDRLESEKEAAETRVAELEGALEPFDGYLGYFDGPNWTDEPDEAPL